MPRAVRRRQLLPPTPFAWAILIACALALPIASPAAVPSPVCFLGFVGDLRKAIGDPLEADDFFLQIHAYNPMALRGTADTLKYVGGERFYSVFHSLEDLRSQGRILFANDEEVFEVVGRLTERSVPGIDQVLGSLAGGFLNAQGAAFDLHVAKRLAGDGADYARIASFQEPFLGGSRRYDIVDSSGRRYENKCWTQGLPDESTEDFQRFLREFQNDIVIDGRNGFASTHYNFHGSVAGDLDTLKERLLAQFDSQALRDAGMTEAEIAAARQAFDDAWQQERILTLYGL